jgi:hypothetical protein
MTDQREATLDELLSEPIILKVMARDGVRAEDVRRLVQQASARTIRTRYRDLSSRAKISAGRTENARPGAAPWLG